jgi:delta-aminolevulinic acid dehydratase/porphobilinogen synthase
MKERKITIFGLSEIKWTRHGRKKLRKGYKLIWSGETTEKRNEAAIIVSPTYAEMVTESRCISGKVMKMRILMKDKEMNIMQIYALQTGCGNEEKE